MNTFQSILVVTQLTLFTAFTYYIVKAVISIYNDNKSN
jgi:hypothetical protein